jgi:excisionase family DNA binding protein
MTDNDSAIAALECETYSVEEAARILGIGRNLAYETVKRGDIRVLGLPGSRARVPRREIERLLTGVSVGRA